MIALCGAPFSHQATVACGVLPGGPSAHYMVSPVRLAGV